MSDFRSYMKKRRESPKEKEEEMTPNASGSFSSYMKKRRASDAVGLDTLESDLHTMGETLNNIYGSWQTKETMDNTFDSVNKMYKRLGGYQDYYTQYGKESGLPDLSELLNNYKKAVEGWGDQTKLYGNYQNADAFNKAVKDYQLSEKFNGLSYDRVQRLLRKYDVGSDEYNYLKNYTGYTSTEDFDKALAGLSTDIGMFDKANEYEGRISSYEGRADVLKGRTRGLTNDGGYGKKADDTRAEYDAWLTEKGFDSGDAVKAEYADEVKLAKELRKAKNIYELDNSTADKYKYLEQNEDFAEHSQYDSSVNEGKKPHYQPFTNYDIKYDYINNVPEIRNSYERKAGNKNAGTAFSDNGWEYLTEKELAYYNYLHYLDNQNGTKESDKFLEDLKPALQKRYSEKASERREEMLENPFAATAFSLVSPIMTMAGGVGNIIASGKDWVTGSEYNPYDPSREISNANAHGREVVSQNIAEATKGFELFGQNIASFLYNTGESVLDTVVGGSALGPGYTALMGANAYQQKAKELTEQGYDATTVQGLAITSGILEMAFEYAGFDHLMKLKDADSIGKVIYNALASQGGAEGLEELGTSIGNMMAEYGFLGEDSQYMKKYNDLIARGFSEKEASTEVAKAMASEIAWSYAGGWLSGVGLGAGKSVGQYTQNKAVGKSLREAERIGDVLNIASMTPEASEAYDAYNKYIGKGITADNITDAQLGNLYNTMSGEASEGFRTANSDLSRAKGIIDKQKAIRESETASEAKKARATAKLDTAIANQTDAQVRRVKYAETLDKLSEIDKKIAEAEEKAKHEAEVKKLSSGVETSVMADTDKAIEIKGMKDSDTLITSDGEVKLKDVELSDRDADLVAYARGMEASEASLYLEQYKGEENIEEYTNTFSLVTSMAKNNFSEDALLKAKGSLSTEQFNAIYAATVTEKYREKQRNIDKLNADMAHKMSYKGVIDDSVINYGNKAVKGKVKWSELNSRQREAITFISGFAKATGMNLKLIADGERKGINGSYDKATNTITIDVYAGISKAKNLLKDTIIPTMSHETTHWMKEKSPELYRKIGDLVFKTLEAHDGISEVDRVASEVAKQKAKGKNITDDGARDEIIARACEDMLKMSEEGKKYFNSLSESEKKTFIDKVKEILANLMEWVDNLLNSYEYSKRDEARIMREYKDTLAELSKMWDEMLVSSVKNNSSMELAGVFGNKNNTSDGEVQLSEREIIGVSGTNYGIGVYLDSNLLTNLTETERKEMLKLFVTDELAGEHFIAYDNNGNAVNIRLATKSEKIKNRKGKKRKVLTELYRKNNNFVVKQEAVVLADELIANAKYDNSKKTRHSHDWLDNYGQNDWDYWKVYIQEKNKTVWEATLNIATSANGEKILYDINPIEMVEEGIKSPSTTTNNIVHDSSSKSNEQSVNNDAVQNSDRDDDISVYEKMGEMDRILKENEAFKAEVERLKERLKLERQVTNGNYFNENQLGAVAGHLRNISNSTYDKVTLMRRLKDVYSYIAHSKELAWDDLFKKCYDIAGAMIAEAKPKTSVNYRYKDILQSIRKTRISLTENQKQEARYKFDKNWIRSFWGKVIIANDGISLDSKWQEWAEDYPEIFKADVNEGNQIYELYEVIESLKEYSETVEEYDAEEMTRWLATEIYNQYWNVSPIRTTADKYNKQIHLLNAEHRRMMTSVREEYNKKLAEQKLADEMYYGKKISEIRNDRDKKLAEQHKADIARFKEIYQGIRERRDRDVAEAKELGKQKMAEYKENVAKKTKIQSITSNVLDLVEKRVDNSKDKHIPEIMLGPVDALLDAINFSSKRLLDGGEPTKTDISLAKSLSKIKDMMAKANSKAADELIELYGHGLDESIEKMVENVDRIVDTIGDNEFVLNRMSLEDLQTLDKVVKTIKQAVNKLNKFHVVNHAKGIANLSQESMVYLDSLGKGKIYDGMRGKISKLLNWNNTLPYYAFKRYGEGGMAVYTAFQDGWDKFAFNVKAVMDYAESAYTNEEVKTWSKEVKEFKILVPAKASDLADDDYTPEYQKVQMTVPQIMSMYCLNKREQARGHLFKGGIRVADFKDSKGKIVSQSDGVVFTEKDVATIFDSLTDRQKAVADKLQEFMNTVCTDWGNEVSMARFGYKAFGEANYFPIQSDKNNLPVDDETKKQNSIFELLNMSFTKSVDDKANNRIVISDIFDVFAQHSSDMAKYNALALPVLDAFKWYNYKEKQDLADGPFKTKSVKQSIETAFGKNGQSYFTTFLKDINGQQEVSRDTLGGGFFSNAKIASVGANLRVVALQPTSYVRASTVIDSRYLTRAFAHKPKIDKAEKWCGIALWKSMGYYDTNIQRGVVSQIKHDETGLDKAKEKSMKLAEMADKITWGYLWNACELEIRDKRKDLEVGSDEFYTEIGKRLREVIYATQVVDSTMTRSQMMRSSQFYDKMLTAFASEPTLSYNMLQDAYMGYSLDARRMGKADAFKKNGKKIARTLVAYTMTNALAALVESGFDAFREDDDEEEMDLATFMKYYLTNFLSDMSITAKIPYIKEAHSVIKGFGSSRTDTQWMDSMVKAGKAWAKTFSGEGSAKSTIKYTLKAFSDLSGLPFYNVYRDSAAFLDKTEIFTSDDLNEMFEDIFN